MNPMINPVRDHGITKYMIKAGATERDVLEAYYMALVDLAMAPVTYKPCAGICAQLDNMVCVDGWEDAYAEGECPWDSERLVEVRRTINRAEGRVEKLMSKWPEGTGSKDFPVPDPETTKRSARAGARAAFYSRNCGVRFDKWYGTAYAAMRWKLVAYLIERLFEEVYGGE